MTRDLNLYLVTRTDEVFWDEYDAIVVAAPSASEALAINPGGDAWDRETLKVRCIGKADTSLGNEPTIVLGSFNAG